MADRLSAVLRGTCVGLTSAQSATVISPFSKANRLLGVLLIVARASMDISSYGV